MAIATEIERIQDAKEVLSAKAVTLGIAIADDKIDTLAEAYNKIAVKDSTNLSASGATVTVPAGYYKTTVSKSVAKATQATPSISVSTSGLITASATQSAGYVSSGTKSATKQLTTKSAQTYTPTTSNQTISSGRYLTGTQTIKGDSNLVASNIKKGVSIFGVAGTYEGSGGTIPTTVKCYLSIGSAPSGFSTVEYTGPNGLALYDFQNSAEVELTVIPGSLLTISFADAMMGGGAMGDLLHYELYWNIGNTFCAITVPPEDFVLFATY